MADFCVHHVRFFEYQPKAIHCILYEKEHRRLAVSRSDGSLEIWSEDDNWFQERIIPGSGDRSVEAVIWQGQRLFTGGLDGEVTEFDMLKLQPKHSAFSHAGPIWCLTKNNEGTRLAAGTEEGCVVLFDIEMDNLQYLKAFDRQEGRILSIAWHAVDHTVVTGGVDNIRLWSTNSGHAVQRLSIGREETAKETIVWAVATTRDTTIISGDSRGKTCFWNSKMGTLLRSFQSHQADVLSLCLNQTEDTVLTVGVDPAIVQFDLVRMGEEGDHTNSRWTRTLVRSGHTHDIRAIALAGSDIITGGVDTNLVFHNMKQRDVRKNRKVPPVPQRSLVSLAKESDLILLQYPTLIEVWKLGTTSRTSDRHGDILGLDTKPVKLVQLRARIGDCVVCSAISPDGSLIAYSDERSIRLYSLAMTELNTLQPAVTLTRIKTLDEDIAPAHLMTFTSANQLITATSTAAVQVMEVNTLEVKVTHMFPPLKDSDCIHVLSVSRDGEHVAMADHKKRVRIYNIPTKQISNIPATTTQVSAMTFSHDSIALCVIYCNRAIYEYNIAKCELTPWSRVNSRILPDYWTTKKGIVSHVTPNPRNNNQYLIQDEDTLAILDKTKPLMATGSGKKKGRGPKGHDLAFKLCSKYKYLLHMEPLLQDWLVVVERTPVSIAETLPATLRQKKFGT